MSTLDLKNVSKTFHGPQQDIDALLSVTLQVRSNEFIVVVGPSGCGKTTLLRIVAGLDTPSQGEVLLDGRPVTGPGRDRGMVFQNFTSFPWLTVRENIAFGLHLQGSDANHVEAASQKWLGVTGLSGFAKQYPSALSGGMQQRVAIARTLACEPSLVLMDEPFGALDAKTRWEMQEVVRQLARDTGLTVIFVTHDVEEAVYLGDRVVVLSARPGMVRSVIDVSLGRDRPRDVIQTKRFMRVQLEILDLLKDERAMLTGVRQ
ncbi:MAG: ABC transporter ATP-binding protein [Vicinamibacteria bacterium]|nr:ABC transporter ATP-binding protein [Vicinamibacteria bacterium]